MTPHRDAGPVLEQAGSTLGSPGPGNFFECRPLLMRRRIALEPAHGGPRPWSGRAATTRPSRDIMIADNHAGVSLSSAAAEIYAAGTATMDLLGLSYVASESEAGIPFPCSFVHLEVSPHFKWAT